MSEWKSNSRRHESISVNIIGCCVCRDIFGLHNNDGGYSIARFVQGASPISIVTESPLLRELEDDDSILFEGKKPFWGRCQKLELEKKILDYVAEEPTDYLIFDVAEFRRKLLVFNENQSFFSENYYLKSFFKKYVKARIVSPDYDVISPIEMDRDECVKLLHRFCNRLLELYDPDRIILAEIKAGLPYTSEDEDPLISAEIKTAEIFNERMAFAFQIVKNYMAGIHVIEFPEGVTIDPNHKWGRNLLHYTMDYYDYALDAINAITYGK